MAETEHATAHSTGDFDKLASVLTSYFDKLAERDDQRMQALENAIIAAIRPVPASQSDPKTTFWNAYKKVADEHDAEFQDKYRGDLDTSLVFAGLFSAVSSAFIIQIQPELQQDPNDVIEALLRILVHAVNSSAIPGDNPILPEWPGPDPEIVVVECLLYVSLGATLLAALLAVLSKQWLAHYSSVGTRGTIVERGLERQRKFDGFRKWGFDLVMAASPVLLQLALLFFAAALSKYLWTVNVTVATVAVSLTSFGMASYMFFVISSIFWSDSPFRTPWSNLIHFIPRFYHSILRICRKILYYFRWISYRRRLRTIWSDHDASDWFGTLNVKAYGFWDALKNRGDPIFIQPSEIEDGNQETYEAAVFWTLDTSTDPEDVAAAALGITTMTWWPTRDVVPAMDRFRDTFVACFLTSPFTLRNSLEHRAVVCARGFYHLHPFTHYWYRRLPYTRDGQVSDNWSLEMQFIFNLLTGWRPGMLFNTIPVPTDAISNGKIDLVTRQLYYSLSARDALNQMYYMQAMERVVFTFQRVDPNTFTSWLLCLGVCCGVAVHPHDLTVLDKSAYCKEMLETILTHFAKFLFNIPVPVPDDSLSTNEAFEKLRVSLNIIIVLVEKLESSLNLYGLLWEALYMLMAVSRFAGDASGICRVLAGYLQNKKEGGEPFVDPQWRRMLTDFEQCNLDGVLAKIPPDMYLWQGVVDWNKGRWKRTQIGFKLMKLHPHHKPDSDGGSVVEGLPSMNANAAEEINDTGIPLVLVHSDPSRGDPSNLSSVSIEHPPAISGVLSPAGTENL